MRCGGNGIEGSRGKEERAPLIKGTGNAYLAEPSRAETVICKRSGRPQRADPADVMVLIRTRQKQAHTVADTTRRSKSTTACSPRSTSGTSTPLPDDLSFARLCIVVCLRSRRGFKSTRARGVFCCLGLAAKQQLSPRRPPAEQVRGTQVLTRLATLAIRPPGYAPGPHWVAQCRATACWRCYPACAAPRLHCVLLRFPPPPPPSIFRCAARHGKVSPRVMHHSKHPHPLHRHGEHYDKFL